MSGLPSKRVIVQHVAAIGICILLGYWLGVFPLATLAAIITTVLRFITGATEYTQPLFHFMFAFIPILILSRLANLLAGLISNLRSEYLFFAALGLLFVLLRVGMAVIYQPRPPSAPFRPIASKTAHNLLRKITTAYLFILSAAFAILSLFVPNWPFALTILLVTFWELFCSTSTYVNSYIKIQRLITPVALD